LATFFVFGHTWWTPLKLFFITFFFWAHLGISLKKIWTLFFV
jgi:hypothetical protein